MSNKETIQKIIARFEKLKSEDPRCGRILCSTCGGYGTAIREKLSINDQKRINDVLAVVSPDEFEAFGVWKMVLEKIAPYGVQSVYQRKSITIDLSDVRSIDSFLFYRRRDYEGSSFEGDYLSMLDQAIALAVRNSDSSLVETLVIILGEKTMQYPELLNIALNFSKDDEDMQRVLYNCLRESVSAVRGYVGNGITVDPSVQPWY